MHASILGFQASPEKNQVIPKLSQRFFQVGFIHRLRTLNEGINQRNLKIWANVANKLCLLHPRIWEWELIFGRAAKVISSSGVHSPWVYIFKRDLQTISLHCTAIFSYVYYKCIKASTLISVWLWNFCFF